MKYILLLLVLINLNFNLSANENLQNKIYKNLRCLVCQGQSIADSNSDFANTIKIVVDDKIEQGMFFTVEPMINIGKYDVRMLNDGWTAVTKDKTLSAQFEHSIGVTQDGHEIFTKSPAGLDKP